MFLRLSIWLRNFQHLFYPHHCLGCGTDVLQHDDFLCIKCLHQLPNTDFFLYGSNPVEKIFYGRCAVNKAGATFYYAKHTIVQNLIKQLKYHNNKEVGLWLGEKMGHTMQESKRFDNIDYLIPLPLNKRKEKVRGYNQAAVICEGIQKVCNIPILYSAVERIVFTETQTKKDRVSRWQNMEGVFRVLDAHTIVGKHVMLVDDVITTGATLESCGNEILKVTGTQLSVGVAACGIY